MSTKNAPVGPAVGQASVTQRRFEEIQLANLSAKFSDLTKTRDIVQSFGGDPDAYLRQIAKQYRDLVTKRRGSTQVTAKDPPAGLLRNLNKVPGFFGSWQTASVPNATAELAIAPTSSDTGGSIGASIYQGDLVIAGDVSNTGAEEQWWVNTWEYIIRKRLVKRMAATMTVRAGNS